jgi:tyrosinase
VQLVDSEIWSADPLAGFGSAQVDENDCVIDGAFSGLELDLTIQLTRGEPTCLKRTLKQDQFDLVSQKVVDACMTLDTYATFSACLGSTPHTSGHYAVGGTVSCNSLLENAFLTLKQMDDVSLSPADPLFFMHHTNLDRLWWEWQSKNASRLTDMTGRNVAAGGILVANQPAILPVSAFLPYFNDGGNVTTLKHVLWTSGTAKNVTIGDVMDINSPTICAAFE